MAYAFIVTTSYGRLRQYTAQVEGGLRARAKDLAPHAPAWSAMKDRIVAERAERELADDAALQATARARVEDADFDSALGDVSSKSYELADKQADQEPYVTLFGKIPAKRAKGFGPAKATEVGARILKDGPRFGHAELDAPLAALATATSALSDAKKAIDEADDALFTPRQKKKKLVTALNTLIAVTEAAILSAFPGRDDIVGAILLPWFERKNKKGGADETGEADPLTPDIGDNTDAGGTSTTET